MTLAAGTKLGPYEITGAIGAGGMGEVYRAKDKRLDRVIAIKVLPSHLASRVELRERFDREAKTIASLNHPHICTLYDIGNQDGIDYLVMEYLEGETLAHRIRKDRLPFDKMMRYAIRICGRQSSGTGGDHVQSRSVACFFPLNTVLRRCRTRQICFFSSD